MSINDIMIITVILTLLMIADILIVILVGVGNLPAKVVMKTMPQELKEETKDHPNPPLWRMIIGFTAYILGVLFAIGISVYAGYEGICRGYGFWEIFLRYMKLMLVKMNFQGLQYCIRMEKQILLMEVLWIYQKM